MASSRQTQNARVFTSCAQEGIYPTIKIEDDGTTTMEYSNSPHHLNQQTILPPTPSQSYSNASTPLESLSVRLTPLNSKSVVHGASVQTASVEKVIKKQDRWTKLEEDTLVHLFNSRKKDLRFKPHYAPAWVKLVEDLKQTCKDHSISCDKNARQCKNKLNYMTKKSKRENGAGWRTTTPKGGQEDECSENEAEETNFDEPDALNSPSNDQESVAEELSVEENLPVQPSPAPVISTHVSVLPVILSPSLHSNEVQPQSSPSTRNILPEMNPNEGNKASCSECQCKRKASTDTQSYHEAPSKLMKFEERGSSDKRQMIEFLEKSQKKYEDILLKYAEIEKQRTEMHLKFTLDAMNMMAQTLKDIVNNQN